MISLQFFISLTWFAKVCVGLCLPENQKADIIFVLDYSGSTSQTMHEQTRTSLAAMQKMLSIGTNYVRFGIVTYGNDADVVLSLQDGGSVRKVVDGIKNLPPYMNDWNSVAAGLKAAIRDFKADTRTDAAKILVLISDGWTDCEPQMHSSCFSNITINSTVAECQHAGRHCSQPASYKCPVRPGYNATETDSAVYTEAEDLKKMGVTVITMFVGKQYDPRPMLHMECWASSPELAFNESDYTKLQDTLVNLVCQPKAKSHLV